jgi:hypothetical protein
MHQEEAIINKLTIHFNKGVTHKHHKDFLFKIIVIFFEDNF